MLDNSVLDTAAFEPITTSYDYDSSLGENGKYTSKYYVFKEMITAANPVKTEIPEEPEYIAPIAYPSVQIEKTIPFAKLLERNAPAKIPSQNVVAMEKIDYINGTGQSNGYIVYRKENIELAPNSLLTIEGKHIIHRKKVSNF